LQGGRDPERASSQQNAKSKNRLDKTWESRSFTRHFLNGVVGCSAHKILHGRSKSIPDNFIIAAFLSKDRGW
jgi:hypothetical protein